PLAWAYDANTFFSRGNRVRDGRNFFEASYGRALGRGDMRWDLSYDQYRYGDRFDYVSDPGIFERHTNAAGDWISSRATYRIDMGAAGTVTTGVEAGVDVRELQWDTEQEPVQAELLRISRPDRYAAVFVEDEKRLSQRWKVDLGIRFDAHRYYGHDFS